MVKLTVVRKSCRGFSLIEAVVTLVVLGIVGTSAYVGVVSSSKARNISQDRGQAYRLTQVAIENLKADAANQPGFFDGLTAQNWAPLPAVSGYPAGFFQSRRVLRPSPSVDLKKVTIDMKWTNDQGQEQTVSQDIDLSRPPQLFHGNIQGVVKRADTNAPIAQALVTIIQGPPSGTYQTLTNASGSYSFVDVWGKRQLPIGQNYLIKVTAPAYVASANIGPIVVREGRDTVQDVTLVRANLAAHIVGTARRPDGTVPPGTFYLSLSQQGVRKATQTTPYNFQIDFPETYTGGELCFTVSGGHSNANSYYPFFYSASKACGGNPWHCLGFVGALPDTAWGKSFNYRGWSSAVSYSSAAPWFGNADTDQVCVSPGETETRDIPLVPIPTATLNITVQGDTNDDGIWESLSGAPVKVYDHSGSLWAQGSTNAAGQISFNNIPAAQELFPETDDYRMKVMASKDFPNKTDCCGVTTTVTRTKTEYVSNLRAGNVRDVLVQVQDCNCQPKCGDVLGVITDKVSGNGIGGASVQVGAASATSQGGGAYDFNCCTCQCPGGVCPYPLGVGEKQFKVIANEYYKKDSSNAWPYVSVSPIMVSQNQVTTRSESLYPVGRGSVVVTVRKGTVASPGNVIVGANVRFFQYGINVTNPLTQQTDAEGKTVFMDVIESWPPTALSQAQLTGYGLVGGNSRHKFDAPAFGQFMAHNNENVASSVVVSKDGETQITLYLKQEGGT